MPRSVPRWLIVAGAAIVLLITATGYFLILYGNVLLARRLSPPSVRVATSIDTSSTASTGR